MLTIVDTRAIEVQFSASAYTDDESAGSALITVTRNSPAGSSSVAYATGGGTAVPGVEYTAASRAPSYFSPGQTTATFSVPLAGELDPGRPVDRRPDTERSHRRVRWALRPWRP